MKLLGVSHITNHQCVVMESIAIYATSRKCVIPVVCVKIGKVM